MSGSGDVLQDEITVNVRGEDYVFRIPSIKFDIEVGYRAASIRRKADPEGRGNLDALDGMAAAFAFNCALLELYLKAGPAWCWSAGAGGKPAVDHEKFPLKAGNLVWEVGGAFRDAFERFRGEGAADDNAAGAETVAGS